MSRRKKRGPVPDAAVSLPGTPPRAYLELWIKLARLKWGSVALVPADPDGSTADMARALADVGQRLSYEPVTAIPLTSVEYGSALALADLQRHVEKERRHAPTPVPVVKATVAPAGDPLPGEEAAPTATAGALATSLARLIISLPSLVANPVGLAAAQESDAVVIVVRMGVTRIADVRRTIELVGRDRIAGCFLVH